MMRSNPPRVSMSELSAGSAGFLKQTVERLGDVHVHVVFSHCQAASPGRLEALDAEAVAESLADLLLLDAQAQVQELGAEHLLCGREAGGRGLGLVEQEQRRADGSDHGAVLLPGAVVLGE